MNFVFPNSFLPICFQLPSFKLVLYNAPDDSTEYMVLPEVVKAMVPPQAAFFPICFHEPAVPPELSLVVVVDFVVSFKSVFLSSDFFDPQAIRTTDNSPVNRSVFFIYSW